MVTASLPASSTSLTEQDLMSSIDDAISADTGDTAVLTADPVSPLHISSSHLSLLPTSEQCFLDSIEATAAVSKFSPESILFPMSMIESIRESTHLSVSTERL